jgi:hypothetical protein
MTFEVMLTNATGWPLEAAATATDREAADRQARQLHADTGRHVHVYEVEDAFHDRLVLVLPNDDQPDVDWKGCPR